jgi:hypothetical protein
MEKMQRAYISRVVWVYFGKTEAMDASGAEIKKSF